LTDSTETSGGFLCIPGFHTVFDQWAFQNSLKMRSGGLIEFPEEDPAQKMAKKIKVRKGSFVVWDSRIVHANYPVTDDKCRMVQYITFEAIPEEAEEYQKECKERSMMFDMKLNCPPYEKAVLTDLGKKLLGRLSWK